MKILFLGLNLIVNSCRMMICFLVGHLCNWEIYLNVLFVPFELEFWRSRFGCAAQFYIYVGTEYMRG